VATHVYALQSTWEVDGTVQEVYDIVSDADGLDQWWPSGFLRVDVLERGDAIGLGKVLEVVTKGWLPYTIHWWQRVTEIDPPNGFTIEVNGGFNGRGVWSFSQVGQVVHVDFDWRIDADKPLLRYGSPILKPIFTWNHRWIMARGEESLKLELERRRASTNEEREAVPPPPAPTWPHRRRQSRRAAIPRAAS
jgi:hypothetical protein